MDKCNKCESRANWKCTVCNAPLCAKHKRIHNDDDREHNIIKFKFKVPEDLKQKVLDSVRSKIRLIDQFSGNILKSSKIIVEQLSILSKGIIIKLEEQRNKTLQILRLLDTEIIDDQLPMIEKEVSEILVYEKCESREGYRWYEHEILKESASASNRREEFLRFGRDLIQGVRNNSLICLETSDCYLAETGTIEGDDFIYNGEIENGLMHGRGHCEFFYHSFYDGEFQNGYFEGKGVYHGVDYRDQCNVYDGEWKSGLREGRGVYKSVDPMKMSWSARFEGKEHNNLPESDYEYDGEWKSGIREGRGVYK